MSWLNPSQYWTDLILKQKTNRSVVEDILLDLFYKKNKNAWLNPSVYWDTLFRKKVAHLTTVERILMDVYMRHHTQYKCRDGMCCVNDRCTFLHPSQYGYTNTLYVANKNPCVYESEVSCCKKKCSNELGMYCIYAHCTHPSKEVIQCAQSDCQGHCPMCI